MSWIQCLSGVSHLAIVRRNAPPSPASSCHCWTVPLPNDRCPTSVARPLSCSAPATISLADALPRSMRTTTRIEGSVATPPGIASVSLSAPLASSSKKIGPEPMNWLATVRAAVT